MNLPRKISFSKLDFLEYLYDAAGNKLRQVVYKQSNINNTTDFISNFVIVNNAPAWINFDEGRVIMDGTAVHFTETHLKDHLGNTRVVFGYKNNALLVKQVSSYYPFGMNIKGLTTQVTIEDAKHPANEYLYNGKMFQDELGLDWLDYGARMYDAQLGRWHSVDPLAEVARRWSPYAYCYNNPIRFIDPDGMLVEGFQPVNQRKDPLFPESNNDDESITWWDEYMKNKLDLPIDRIAYKDEDKDKKKKKDDGGKTNGSPSDGSTPSVEDDVIEGIGVALVKIGEKFYSAVITKDGKVVQLPTDRAYNIFANSGKYINLRSTANVLKIGGKYITIAGQGATVVGVYFDYQAYTTGDISGPRFSYRLGIAGTSTLVGAKVGGPWGFVAGAVIGTIGWLGEKVYDVAIEPAFKYVGGQFDNMGNAINSGKWYPGKY